MSDLQKVGPDWGGIGTFKPFTATGSGAQRIADAHSRYMQATAEGRVFVLDSDSVTIAAANATKSAMGTAKYINGFTNPPNSGKLAVIIAAHVATVSGTPGGPILWNFFPFAVINSATTGTIRNAVLGLGGNNGGSAMNPQVNVTLTSIGALTTALVQLGVMGGPAAIATGAGLYDAYEEVAGRIIVAPGMNIGLCATATGTTHIVQSTIIWEEVPISSLTQ
jgi:hypothetical protein